MSTPWTAAQKVPPVKGDPVILYGKAKHGAILRGVVIRLEEDDYIGNPEEWMTVEVIELLQPERLPDGYRAGMVLRFRRPVSDHGYGRNWRPSAKALRRSVGYVRILREETP